MMRQPSGRSVPWASLRVLAAALLVAPGCSADLRGWSRSFPISSSVGTLNSTEYGLAWPFRYLYPLVLMQLSEQTQTKSWAKYGAI
mmetsp:Transcript_91324/g.235795  ORF Transcript_91324/g.235795 Transcript_91324/m.235795 type:complete len:86 (-) Transcript_91324:99-356(-)